MADEITKLKSNNSNAELLFIYRNITPPTYTDADSVVKSVIATPSAELPLIAIDLLTVAEKAALDLGNDAFEVVNMEIDKLLSNAELLSRGRALYAQKKSEFTINLTSQFDRFGQRFDS